MGYRIWTNIQAVLGLLLGWVLLDVAVEQLWVANFFNTQTPDPWLNTNALIAWLIIAIFLLQLVKGILIIVRKD